jgi:hypothetical protein
MPCDSQLQPGQTLAARVSEIDLALKRLEQYLSQGKVTIGIGANGAITFKGWATNDRNRVTDVCAYRTLTSQSSWALRQATAKAEAMSGRKVNAAAVAAGVHSHDGGGTWHKGH